MHTLTRPATTALALLTLATMLACRSAPDANPDPRPASPTLDALLRRLPPDPALTLALFPDRLAASSDDLTVALSAFGAERLAPSIVTLGGLQGLDRARPVVLAGFSPPGPARFQSASLGNILDPEEAPPFLHGRLILPATDPGLLLASAMALASEIDLDMLPLSGPWREIAPKGVMLVGQGLLAAVIPEPDALRVEIALNARDIEAASATLAALARAQPAPRDRQSPAWTHFLEGEGVASAHIDLGAWATMDAAYELSTIQSVLPQIPRDQMLPIMSTANSLAMSAAIATNPAHRRVRDMTLSLSISRTIDLRLTRTLLDESAPPASAPHTFPPRSSNPTFSLQLKAIPADALKAGQQPGDALRQSGLITRLYILINDPLATLAAAAPQIFGQVPETLPSALSLTIDRVDAGPDGALNPVLAFGLTFPRDEAQATADALKALGEGPDSDGLTVEVRPLDDAHALVLLSLGASPDELLDLEHPLTTPSDLDASVDLSRLLPLLLGPALNPAALTRLNTLKVVNQTQGTCHTTSLRLGTADDKAPLTPILIQAPPSTPRPAITAGEACLNNASDAIHRHLVITSGGNGVAHDRVDEALIKDGLKCARDHGLAAQADAVEGGWLLWSARAMTFTQDEELAFKHADAACALGREVACRLKVSLEPPYPPGTMTLPKVAWGKAALMLDRDARLSLTNEGLYLDSQRLSDLKRLDASPGTTIPWLTIAIGAARPHKESDDAWRLGVTPRIDILADADTPYGRVSKLLHAAESAGFEVQIVLKGLDAKSRAFRPLLPLQRPDDKTRPPEPPDASAPADAYLHISRAVASLRHQGAEVAAINLQPDSVDPTEALIALSRACQGIQDKAGAQIIYRVVIEPDVPFQEALRVLGALGIPPLSQISANPEAFNATIDGYNPFDSGDAPHTVVLDDPEPPPSSKPAEAAGLNAPNILDRGAIILGAIDKDDIRDVIRRGQPTIKFCYEKSLINDPKLVGRVMVKFTIGVDGSVISADIKASDLGDKPLEQCLSQAIKRLKFPKPRGGGIVIVSYPFNFNTAE